MAEITIRCCMCTEHMTFKAMPDSSITDNVNYAIKHAYRDVEGGDYKDKTWRAGPLLCPNCAGGVEKAEALLGLCTETSRALLEKGDWNTKDYRRGELIKIMELTNGIVDHFKRYIHD